MKKEVRAYISAAGRYAPSRVLTNEDLEKMVETTSEWIVERTGIYERHISEKDEATSHMGVKAFQDMQKKFNVDPESIDVIIVATVTPDMLFPQTSALIQEKIGAKNAWGFDLLAACSGFIFALNTAVNFIESGRYKKVLVIGSDKMSSIVDYTDRTTCILFGDAAGAVLVEPSPDPEYGVIDSILHVDGTGAPYLYMKGGGSLHPPTHETIDKKMHYIYQEGRTVFKFAVNGMSQVSEEILKKNGLSGKDLTMFIPHQANKRIIDFTGEKLGLSKEQVWLNIDRYGNTTAATIPFGISECVDYGKLKKGDYLLLSAFGAGFTWGSILIRWGF